MGSSVVLLSGESPTFGVTRVVFVFELFTTERGCRYVGTVRAGAPKKFLVDSAINHHGAFQRCTWCTFAISSITIALIVAAPDAVLSNTHQTFALLSNFLIWSEIRSRNSSV